MVKAIREFESLHLRHLSLESNLIIFLLYLMCYCPFQKCSTKAYQIDLGAITLHNFLEGLGCSTAVCLR